MAMLINVNNTAKSNFDLLFNVQMNTRAIRDDSE